MCAANFKFPVAAPGSSRDASNHRAFPSSAVLMERGCAPSILSGGLREEHSSALGCTGPSSVHSSLCRLARTAGLPVSFLMSKFNPAAQVRTRKVDLGFRVPYSFYMLRFY